MYVDGVLPLESTLALQQSFFILPEVEALPYLCEFDLNLYTLIVLVLTTYFPLYLLTHESSAVLIRFEIVDERGYPRCCSPSISEGTLLQENREFVFFLLRDCFENLFTLLRLGLSLLGCFDPHFIRLFVRFYSHSSYFVNS